MQKRRNKKLLIFKIKRQNINFKGYKLLNIEIHAIMIVNPWVHILVGRNKKKNF